MFLFLLCSVILWGFFKGQILGWKDLEELEALVILDRKDQNFQEVLSTFQLYTLFSLAFPKIFKMEYLRLLYDISYKSNKVFSL